MKSSNKLLEYEEKCECKYHGTPSKVSYLERVLAKKFDEPNLEDKGKHVSRDQNALDNKVGKSDKKQCSDGKITEFYDVQFYKKYFAEKDALQEKCANQRKIWKNRNTKIKIQIEKIIRKNVGPDWFQDLSNYQMKLVYSLPDVFALDKQQGEAEATKKTLYNIGIFPSFSSKLLKKCIKESQDDTIKFLFLVHHEIVKLEKADYEREFFHAKRIGKKISVFSLNERLILSSVFLVHFDTLLAKLDEILPPPVKPTKILWAKKPVRPKPKLHSSPYLQPLPMNEKSWFEERAEADLEKKVLRDMYLREQAEKKERIRKEIDVRERDKKFQEETDELIRKAHMAELKGMMSPRTPSHDSIQPQGPRPKRTDKLHLINSMYPPDEEQAKKSQRLIKTGIERLDQLLNNQKVSNKTLKIYEIEKMKIKKRQEFFESEFAKLDEVIVKEMQSETTYLSEVDEDDIEEETPERGGDGIGDDGDAGEGDSTSSCRGSTEDNIDEEEESDEYLGVVDIIEEESVKTLEYKSDNSDEDENFDNVGLNERYAGKDSTHKSLGRVEGDAEYAEVLGKEKDPDFEDFLRFSQNIPTRKAKVIDDIFGKMKNLKSEDYNNDNEPLPPRVDGQPLPEAEDDSSLVEEEQYRSAQYVHSPENGENQMEKPEVEEVKKTAAEVTETVSSKGEIIEELSVEESSATSLDEFTSDFTIEVSEPSLAVLEMNDDQDDGGNYEDTSKLSLFSNHSEDIKDMRSYEEEILDEIEFENSLIDEEGIVLTDTEQKVESETSEVAAMSRPKLVIIKIVKRDKRDPRTVLQILQGVPIEKVQEGESVKLKKEKDENKKRKAIKKENEEPDEVPELLLKYEAKEGWKIMNQFDSDRMNWFEKLILKGDQITGKIIKVDTTMQHLQMKAFPGVPDNELFYELEDKIDEKTIDLRYGTSRPIQTDSYNFVCDLKEVIRPFKKRRKAHQALGSALPETDVKQNVNYKDENEEKDAEEAEIGTADIVEKKRRKKRALIGEKMEKDYFDDTNSLVLTLDEAKSEIFQVDKASIEKARAKLKGEFPPPYDTPFSSDAELEVPKKEQKKDEGEKDCKFSHKALDVECVDRECALVDQEELPMNEYTLARKMLMSVPAEDRLEAAIKYLAEKGDPLAILPDIHKVPWLTRWYEKRRGIRVRLTQEDHDYFMTLSQKIWDAQYENVSTIPVKTINRSNLTWDNIDWLRKKSKDLMTKYQYAIKSVLVTNARNYFPTMYCEYYKNPYMKRFRDTFFTYLPGRPNDAYTIRPWAKGISKIE